MDPRANKHVQNFRLLPKDELVRRKVYFEDLIQRWQMAGVQEIESIYRLEAINHLLENSHG